MSCLALYRPIRLDGEAASACTQRDMSARPPALVVEVPASLVGPLWRLLRQHLTDRARNGATVRPDEAAFRDTLRAAYLDQLQATSGHPIPSFPDMTPSSDHRTRTGPALVRTAQLADALGVTDRHARRMARAAGLVQPRRGWWRADDAAALIAARRNR